MPKNSRIGIYFLLNISSSSLWLGTDTDFPDPRLPIVPIVHRSRFVFHATSRITAKLLLIGSGSSP